MTMTESQYFLNWCNMPSGHALCMHARFNVNCEFVIHVRAIGTAGPSKQTGHNNVIGKYYSQMLLSHDSLISLVYV